MWWGDFESGFTFLGGFEILEDKMRKSRSEQVAECVDGGATCSSSSSRWRGGVAERHRIRWRNRAREMKKKEL